MMSLKKGSLNAAQAGTYYEEKYTQDDYYTEEQRVTGQWLGQGAARLGLAGDVSREDFSALLQGIHPRSGAVLVAKASGYGEHAAGWDGVFNAPKSVSIQALIGDDYRLLEAHKAAVGRALEEVEKYAMARQHGGRELIATANVTAAAFTHLAARPVEEVGHGPDPHLHTHVVFLNVTTRPDRAIRALSPVEIYRSQELGSAVYRSELALAVQRLGYRINVTAGNGPWELDGYTREQVMAFSERRRQIEEKMEELGVSGPKAAQLVTLATRQSKEQYDEHELKAEWKTRAAEYGIDAKRHLWQALGRNGSSVDPTPGTAHDALQFAKAHTTNREAVVDRRDLEVAALQHGMRRASIDSVRREMGIEEQAQRLVRAQEPDFRHPQGSFTTPEMLALELQNVAMMRAGQGQAHPIALPVVAENWGQRQGLSGEQIGAMQMMLASPNWITALDAIAGSGKTTTVGALRQLA